MYRAVSFILISAACLLITVSECTRQDEKERLTRKLLASYMPGVDPGNTELKIGFTVICAKFDKPSGMATINGWEYFEWKDARMAWDPSKYGNITLLRIPSRSLWTPDVKLFNAMTSGNVRDDDTNVVVVSDGTVLWVPPSTYRVHCNDKQDHAECKLRIGSWTYDGYNLALKPRDSGAFDLEYYDDMCPSIVSSYNDTIVSHIYPCCPEPYPSLDVSFNIAPRS